MHELLKVAVPEGYRGDHHVSGRIRLQPPDQQEYGYSGTISVAGEYGKSFEPGWRLYKHDRNPEFNEFLFEDILGKAIRSIASGIEEMDDALEKAQEECDRAFNEISESYPISIVGGRNR